MRTSKQALGRAETTTLLRRGLVIEYSSVAWMIAEALGAIIAGVLSGSLALLAFGGDSIVELASSITVLGHLRAEDRGEGTDQKTERTEQVTLLLLFLLIPVIGFGAAYAYFSGVEPEASVLGIIVAVASIVIMPVLWFEKRRIGKHANCLPIEVDATESATCFLMSAALLLALVVNFLWRLWWVDYVATGFILVFLTREAFEALHHFRGERGPNKF